MKYNIKHCTEWDIQTLLEEKDKEIKILNAALEECIAQFDYLNNKDWQRQFKESMIEIAKKEIAESEGSIDENIQKNV